MLAELSDILEVVTIVISVFLLERYVFLEPQMEQKKQQIFYFICIVLIIFTFILFGKDAASLFVILLGGINIVLGRNKHRFSGFFLAIPFMGIVNGLLVPVWVMPPYLLGFSETGILYYGFIVYGLIAFLLLCFWKKGKNWRDWFEKNVKKQSLNWWEKGLLCTVGMLMLFFSNITTRQIMLNEKMKTAGESYALEGTFAADIMIYGLIAFVLTVTMIVLIMQGNKRNSYHEQVLGMQYHMIAAMADLVENRDENTGGHIKRTGEYVKIIADTLSRENAFPEILTKQYVADMVVAAPLHDIGKIHIPDAILNKPGRLTDEEFAIMKSHAAVGRDLLEKIKEQTGEFSYLTMAVDMAAYHHEWWNGKGYPDGISEEEIPLCARIMAVADVFDALTSKRCYKEAMPVEKAYEIIKQESGTHFDAVVVEAFLASKKQVEEVLYAS